MKEIPLTQGKVAFVDDSDFDFLNQWKWYTHKIANIFYAVRYVDAKAILMHRAILAIADRKILCDHIDHNGLNNQRRNLRTATYLQNNANRRPSKNSTSKYLGVHIQSKKWRAEIASNNRNKYIGMFKTEEEAARAYDEVAKRIHGEFANLNFKTNS